jgi:hypothetical protein
MEWRVTIELSGADGTKTHEVLAAALIPIRRSVRSA